MGGELDPAKDELLRTVVEACAQAPGDRPGDHRETVAYLRLYYRHVPHEDLAERDPADIYGPALAHWRLGRVRPQGRANVRVFNPSREEDGWDPGRTVVQVVTDDMPYLVDSVTMELLRHDLTTQMVVHPLLGVDRDVAGRLHAFRAKKASPHDLDESWIHIEVDRITDPGLLKQVEEDLQRVLRDVRVAYEDEPKMRALAKAIAREISQNPPPLPDKELAEGVELLDWLAGGHFIFLGYRDYDLSEDGSVLTPVTGTGLGILRHDKSHSGGFAALPPPVRAKAREKKLLVLTKANSRSTVHRPHYLDYIGVKKFDANGEVVGERRFLGLFTYVAYSESIAHIPVLKRKLDEVIDRAGFTPDSHDGQDLAEILETYPRDELFQMSVEELLPIALGVLRLRDRKQLKLFLRKDVYGRYMSCLIYLPRDRYTTQIRLRMQEILRRAFNGVAVDYSAMVSESTLARLHIVVRGERGEPLPEADPAELEARLAAATRSWADDLADAIAQQCEGEQAGRLAKLFGDAFPEGYKADFPAHTAVADLRRLDALREDGEISIDLYKPRRSVTGERRLKIYRLGPPISLSHILPLLHNMGVEVVDERPYEIVTSELRRYWIYDLGLRYQPVSAVPEDQVKELFEDAFRALWRGDIENDGFNALVLHVGLTWKQAMVLRAYAMYLRQTGINFSKRHIEQVLLRNAAITRLLVRLWESRLDPALIDGEAERSTAIAEEITGALEEVESLDEDRILRSYLALINATLRTNHFQDKPYLSLKFDPRSIPNLPEPRPKFEIFVYSPRTEGVHLRFGSVARGGLRWSDRPEDFRTEILGLVKAQAVKNTVIVPAGAKGGFVGKRLPDPAAGRDAYLAAGVACYKEFISGLLDITDNLVDGAVVPPPKVVRHDGDDPYLVVAADKGTATFSDIANEVAASYGFWLGDAFASGGSVGYDHKAMGITARGAWESVKYHFRTLGKDIQREDFTVVGIGDMSGDVFGNGMLLSRHIKLVAAFDHRHIFIDPDPDPERSYAERKRLFEMPRSSWADYDPALISPGGGVFPRTAKSVRITPQMRRALGIGDEVTAMTPFELIHAVLCAPVDLLWNGGIGTYVKATSESHADVGDKANDAVRANAAELRCKVVGEGGNLGFTQLARIEYALRGGPDGKGGLINTDFIDNSAGVDTSDHEVNIKILLDQAVRDGELTRDRRDALLDEMTDEVAELVLADNYAQNVVLAAARRQAPSMLHVHGRYLRKLEREGRLDRRLEFLPDDKTLAERRQAGLGLTGPEFAVLLAYTKLTLDAELLASDLPDDPSLQSWLVDYFPTPLRGRLRPYMDRHPLRREIITTRVVNDLVNNSGTTFIFRINEETGAAGPDIARAYLVARQVFDMPRFWRRVEGLSYQVEESTQIKMLLEARKLTERGTRWLLRNRRPHFGISDTIDFFAAGARALTDQLPKLLAGLDLARFEERRTWFTERGVPDELAEQVALMVPAYSTFDLVEIARDTGREVTEVAEVYFDLADRLQLARLRERIIALPRGDRWKTMARAALRDDLYAAHAALTRDVLASTEPGLSPEERLTGWSDKNHSAVARAQRTLGEIWESDSFDLATLTVALGAIRTLVTAVTL
ncbi:NAD-glutamate dehydrogenase [Thermomonospora curvata]|uniref:NAD-glutamate dehydrogenase n=1 Tax=Thermomonospora curvata (strain ATCC 19995 / DSM 43183 / JCM 3096 / KCTC 9072 / NBRC 15933 / NCIMB 10081 / Henssen B9) TaxID=471852 RepID=D1AEZ6_THECD|nr:NAD-glutamate dehydrogenase [Thermomonospora curvata]ACY99540.1 NAD-glutamate dehydrogenase [Thermomonospora curvata DSM 43183]